MLWQRAGSWFFREVEDAEEWVVEGASHGLADTTCFELYGFPNQAPPLTDSPTAAMQVSPHTPAVGVHPQFPPAAPDPPIHQCAGCAHGSRPNASQQ